MTSALNPRVNKPRRVFNLHVWRRATSTMQVDIERHQRQVRRVAMRAAHAVSITKARDAKFYATDDDVVS